MKSIYKQITEVMWNLSCGHVTCELARRQKVNNHKDNSPSCGMRPVLAFGFLLKSPSLEVECSQIASWGNLWTTRAHERV